MKGLRLEADSYCAPCGGMAGSLWREIHGVHLQGANPHTLSENEFFNLKRGDTENCKNPWQEHSI